MTGPDMQKLNPSQEGLLARFQGFVENPYIDNGNWDTFLLPQFAAFIAIEEFERNNSGIDLNSLAPKAVTELATEAARVGVNLATWNERIASGWVEADTLEKDRKYYLSHFANWLASKYFPVERQSLDA